MGVPDDIFRLYLGIRCGNEDDAHTLGKYAEDENIYAMFLFMILLHSGVSTFSSTNQSCAKEFVRLCISDLELLCEASDPYAQFLLGWLYHDGIGCEVNFARAVELYRASAQAHFSWALCHLGSCYAKGEGVEKNIDEANRLYRLVMDNPIALCNLACNVLVEDAAAGLELLRQSAETGFGRANYILGCAHHHGLYGLPVSLSLARNYYELAAVQGNDEGAYAAGLIYAQPGPHRNTVKAFEYLKQATRVYHLDALFRVGQCYSDGIGVEVDLEMAYHYYEEAASRGHLKALVMVGICCLKGTGVDIDHECAASCFRIAGNKGDVNALCNLALCYQFGCGIEKDELKALEIYETLVKNDLPQAIYGLSMCYSRGAIADAEKSLLYLQRAATMGWPQAYYELGNRYFSGTGVERNVDEGLKCYRIAAEKGLTLSQRRLAKCYYHGIGVAVDFAAAVKYFRAAAKNGDDEAAAYLGSCYEDGKGVPCDCMEALYWYRFAAKKGNKFAIRKLSRIIVYSEPDDNAIAAPAA